MTGRQQSTLAPESKAADDIADLWWVMFVGSAVVFAVVLALVVAAVLRRRGEPARGESRRALALVLFGGAVVPFVVLVALFALVLRTMPSTAASDGPAELTVEVTGRQWFWEVAYPDRDVRTANEIHIPVGTPVQLRVRSRDVIHSFWVPRLTRKIDMIPGRTNSIVVEARKAGVYRGQCAEYCGLQHARMAFYVVAELPAAFRSWLARQAKPPTAPAGEGRQVFLDSGCGGCHRIEETSEGDAGPDLTHFGSRRTIGAGTLTNTRANLVGWILDPQHAKPGNKMPGTTLSDSQLQALVRYLRSLD
jgi:cytochrome c oxidase subunit 2